MRRSLLLIFGCFSLLSCFSQSTFDFSLFANKAGDTSIILAKDILREVDWPQLMQLTASTGSGHRAYEEKDSLLMRYRYVKQAGLVQFHIVTYKDTVLEFSAERIDDKQATSYFNTALWLRYVNEMLPNLAAAFKLSSDEKIEVLKNYYGLLGINTRDEYGFICEYSATGRPPAKRKAIIFLIQQDRFDLIKKLTEYPNLQTKLYAIDALIFRDYQAKNTIGEVDDEINSHRKKLETLQKKSDNADRIASLTARIKSLGDSIAYLKTNILTENEWKNIFDWRNRGQMITTCGNNGSYKVYATPISELLSDKAIKDIPRQYEKVMPVRKFR
jgi:hypothetical protein